MTQYARGRRKEWEVCKRLRAEGYTVVRSAGSRGLWDVMAIGQGAIRLIQVKYAKKKGWWDANCQTFLELAVPEAVTKEVWLFTKGNSTPFVRTIQVADLMRRALWAGLKKDIQAAYEV